MTRDASNPSGDELAVAFLTRHDQHRTQIRLQSQQAAVGVARAHQCALSAVISYLQRAGGIQFANAGNTSKQMALIAQFVQGIAITETAISEGLYPQAAALLKQELETIVQLENIANGMFEPKKTPKLPKGSNLGRCYGQLNEAAHPSNAEILEHFASYAEKSRQGPTQIPQFDKHAFLVLYDHQIVLLIRIYREMDRVFSAALETTPNRSEVELLLEAARVLEQKRSETRQGTQKTRPSRDAL